MRLIDADELRKKSTHARDIARYDGDLLVIGLGYLLDAPTHDADKLRVALEGLYNAVAKQRYAEGSELMDAWKAAGDVLGISETQEPPPSYRTATELKAEKKGNQTGIRR